MTKELARVRWRMGQTLLPEHFDALEESLSREAALRKSLGAVPDYGIADLTWDETFLSEGIVSISSMGIVLPSGILLKIPGNAELSAFNLEETGSVRVVLYLHLFETLSAETEDGEKEIPRKIRKLSLSSGQGCPGAVESMWLGAFEKGLEGVWRLDNAALPPLLRVGSSPFLKETLKETAGKIELFRCSLEEEIAAGFLGGESLFSARQCLKEVYRIIRLLGNLEKQVFPHPYHLFESLCSFHTELCFYRNSVPEQAMAVYDHDRLSECFQKILGALWRDLDQAKGHPPYLDFNLSEGVYAMKLPPEIRAAGRVYFLAQKDHRADVTELENLKMAALSRLRTVHQFSLDGVKVERIGRPPFRSPFGPEVEYFSVNPGAEWDRVMEELTLGFFPVRGCEAMRFFIYWHRG